MLEIQNQRRLILLLFERIGSTYLHVTRGKPIEQIWGRLPESSLFPFGNYDDYLKYIEYRMPQIIERNFLFSNIGEREFNNAVINELLDKYKAKVTNLNTDDIESDWESLIIELHGFLALMSSMIKENMPIVLFFLTQLLADNRAYINQEKMDHIQEIVQNMSEKHDDTQRKLDEINSYRGEVEDYVESNIRGLNEVKGDYRIYKLPNNNSLCLGIIKAYQRFELIEQNDNWHRIRYVDNELNIEMNGWCEFNENSFTKINY